MKQAIAVTGASCAGKTTYCRKLVAETKPRPIFVPVGGWMRDAFSVEFFVEIGRKSPELSAAPPACDPWIRSILHHALVVASALQRDLVIDGYPRTAGQVDWLLACIENHRTGASAEGWNLEVRALVACEDIRQQRAVGRAGGDRDSADFALSSIRLAAGAGAMDAVQEHIEQFAASKGGRRWAKFVAVNNEEPANAK